MKRRWIVSGVGALLLLAPAFANDSSFLDGTTCRIKVVPDGPAAKNGAREFADNLRFADGLFSSGYFATKGFKPAHYRGEREPNEAEFEVEQTSETDGLINWLGEIRGTNVAGRLQWQKKDGTSLSYDFKGTTN